MFIVDTFEPIIEQTKPGATDFLPLWIFGLIVLLMIALGIILIRFDELVVGIVFMIIGTLIFGGLGLLTFTDVNASTGTQYNTKGMQKLAEQTYLIELTDDEADLLIQNRIVDPNVNAEKTLFL